MVNTVSAKQRVKLAQNNLREIEEGKTNTGRIKGSMDNTF